MPDLTPTQQRMYAVLEDGYPHTPKELHACLDDELGPLTNIQPHLTLLRRKLAPLGQDVICRKNGTGPMYRLVRTVQKE